MVQVISSLPTSVCLWQCFQGSQSGFMVMAKGSGCCCSLFSLMISTQICSDCHIQLYVNDTVMYSSPDISQIHCTSQAVHFFLQYSIGKEEVLCCLMFLSLMLCGTRSDLLLQTNNWSINVLDETPLKKVEEFKYLGLWLDSQQSFNWVMCLYI